MASSTKLGPFELRAPLGHGGMGTVWSGVHVGPAGEWPVAVKRLTAELARRPAYQAAFRNEVRAVAALDHPRIVRVFDHGVDAEGAPWLAMELAPRGTLASAAPEMTWHEVRAALVAILDGLAHAHARGVVHRDLKPANVLGWGDGDWRLADFGIAHARAYDHGGIIERASGTPLYMAPEQVRGDLREQGPWTDLYALGCLTWELVTGVPPFRGGAGDLVRAHLEADPPRLVPRMPVPAELEAWLLRLLAKAPAERFRAACDAALALGTLGPPVGTARGGSPGPGTAATTLVEVDVEPVAVVASAAPGAMPVVRAPVPREWRTPVRPPDPELLGVGLGLYGLRDVPLVGRKEERDRLWTLLHDAGPRIAVLSGAAGVGKSRLARWLTERAAEAGVAVLSATHAPVEGPADGVAAMIARYLRVDGLPRAAIERRAPGWVDVVAPATPVSAAVRFAAIERLLAGIGPVVLWLDDVQWGAEALGLAAWLAEGRLGVPALVVATVREEALPERPVEAELLAGLPAERIRVEPLDAARRRELVQRLLGFEGDLAARVEERTAGNPLFAVQLVGDWVARGVLEVGRHGFRVAPGADLSLPDDLGAVWLARIARCVPEEERPAVVIAAVLGQDVDVDEWREACAIAGVSASDAVLERLLDERLLRSDAPGRSFGFVHGMLRESLLGDAGERIRGYHAACARMLGGRRGAMVPERLGRHLVGAGRHEEAVDPLFDAAYHRQVRGEYGASEALYADRDEAMRAAGVPASDERWGQGWFRRATIARNRGRMDEADAWCVRTIEAGEANGWTRTVADALVTRALLASLKGQGSAAWPWIERALALLPEGPPQARARLVAGEILLNERRYDEARAAFEAALTADRDIVVAEAWRFLGHLGLRTGRMDDAAAALDQAVAVYERLGDPSGVGNCTNDRAAIAHVLGRYEEAAAGYRRAVRELWAIGGLGDAMNAQVNLAVVLVLLDQPEEALEHAHAVQPMLVKTGRVALVGLIDLVFAACGVETDVRLEAGSRAMDATGYSDTDVVLLARRIEALGGATAERARALAEKQERLLGG